MVETVCKGSPGTLAHLPYFNKVILATLIGLEPTTSSVTGWHSNQLNYKAIYLCTLLEFIELSTVKFKCWVPTSRPNLANEVSSSRSDATCFPRGVADWLKQSAELQGHISLYFIRIYCTISH